MGFESRPAKRQTDVIVQEFKDELLVYDLQGDRVHCLNKTAMLIYELCDGNNSVSDISKLLSEKLRQTVSEGLIWVALDQLKQENLLIENHKLEIDFKGLSRREAIRKVGLASVIALPLLTSLITPKAAAAQSAVACVTDGGACSLGNPGACCTRACTQPSGGSAFCCTTTPGPFQCPA